MIVDRHRDHDLDLPALRRFLVRARRAAGLRGGVAVRLADDRALRALNRDFLGRDYPTDVLSFPSGGDGEGNPAVAISPLHAGDLAVSLDAAARQARRHRHPLDAEVRILLLHGVLHLAGFDHETDAGEMRRRERELRLALGLPPGLIERACRGAAATRGSQGCAPDPIGAK